MRIRACVVACVVACVTSASALTAGAFTMGDVDFWVGQGPNRAVLVADWHDAQPALAWGYRFEESVTSETMIRDIASADSRLHFRLGSGGPFGVPLFGVGYDQNQTGFALSDGTQFTDGIAVTGPSDGATAADAHDRYAEGWFDGHWGLYTSTDEPYTTGAWGTSGLGISSRILEDGDWDGLSFSNGPAEIPSVPIPAQRFAFDSSFHEVDLVSTPAGQTRSVPEPSFGALWLFIALGLSVRATAGRSQVALVLCALPLCVSTSTTAAADGFATSVVAYESGTGVSAGFDDPSAALGIATRFTSPNSNYGGPVTPFNAPFGSDELVSIGFGGSLTLGFDQPIIDRDNPSEFGFDFIVFGNAFFFDGDFPNGVVAGIGEEPGAIDVSQDGVNWFSVSAMADTAFPTMGYQDVTDAFPSAAGNVPTNFHRPVDPSIDPMGMSMVDLIDAYAGSGGGAGIDIGPTGLDWVQYVRISNLHDEMSMITPEIDAISVVPEPMSLWAFGWAGLLGWACRRQNLQRC